MYVWSCVCLVPEMKGECRHWSTGLTGPGRGTAGCFLPEWPSSDKQKGEALDRLWHKVPSLPESCPENGFVSESNSKHDQINPSNGPVGVVKMPVLGMGNTWLQIWQRRSTLDPKRERKRHRYFFNETKCPIALGPQGRRIKGCFIIPPILFHFPFIHHLSWRHCWSSIVFGTSSMGSNLGEFKFWNNLVLRTVGKKIIQIKQ